MGGARGGWEGEEVRRYYVEGGEERSKGRSKETAA